MHICVVFKGKFSVGTVCIAFPFPFAFHLISVRVVSGHRPVDLMWITRSV